MRKLKVALCIPCHGDTKAKFTQSLAAMIAHSCGAVIEYDGEPTRLEFETLIVSSSILPESRNRLVAEALHYGADYMLWMDADHVFPCDALLRLLCRSELVVGCNYARRASPTWPTASKRGDDDELDLVYTTKEKAEANELEEVAHIGLGFCLMDMRLFAILEEKSDTFWPLFDMEPTEDKVRFVGEDVHLFKKIREAGVKVYCDHGLSWELGHVTEQILTNAHCLVQKAKYEEWVTHKMDKFTKEAVE